MARKSGGIPWALIGWIVAVGLLLVVAICVPREQTNPPRTPVLNLR